MTHVSTLRDLSRYQPRKFTSMSSSSRMFECHDPLVFVSLVTANGDLAYCSGQADAQLNWRNLGPPPSARASKLCARRSPRTLSLRSCDRRDVSLRVSEGNENRMSLKPWATAALSNDEL